MLFTVWILGFPLFVLNLILLLLPNVELPAGISSALTGLFELAKPFTHLFPLDTLFTVVGLVFAIESALLIWKIVNYVWRSIPIFGRH